LQENIVYTLRRNSLLLFWLHCFCDVWFD